MAQALDFEQRVVRADAEWPLASRVDGANPLVGIDDVPWTRCRSFVAIVLASRQKTKPATGEPAAGASHEPWQYIRGQGTMAIRAAG